MHINFIKKALNGCVFLGFVGEIFAIFIKKLLGFIVEFSGVISLGFGGFNGCVNYINYIDNTLVFKSNALAMLNKLLISRKLPKLVGVVICY